ncbi:MAG: methyltransferase domain-containing protein [Leptolyngbya sp.]|nr:methyltransferase domain-containing protein [Candidatus Melainabacteria bacterium]
MDAHDLIKHSYERSNLVELLREALSKAGFGNNPLSIRDLAPLDHFHSRGIQATKELANALTITSESKILDIGSGLGGPARYLASTFGCHVCGIDLTQSYVNAAKYLSERVGLSEMVSFQCANALALPYDDCSFDIVWTQHVAMNIQNKTQLYSEIFRVLKIGGQFAFYDVVAGEGSVYFPVPWSDGPETSFLLTPDAMLSVLTESGFKSLSWIDRTEEGISWFSDFQKKQSQNQGASPKLGLGLVVGPDFGTRAANLGRSLNERKVGLLEGVLEKEA